MNAPRFDSTVTLGHIITAASMVVAIVNFCHRYTAQEHRRKARQLHGRIGDRGAAKRTNRPAKERLREVERRVK